MKNQRFKLAHWPLMLSVLFAVSSFTNAQDTITVPTAYDTQSQRIELPAEMRYPNGITHDKTGALYLGSVVSGDILKIKPNGETEVVFHETEEVFAGTSLRYDPQTDILWVASPDYKGVTDPDGNTTKRANRIAAIHLSTRELIKYWLIPDEGFGNDIALDYNGGVYITDSINDRIYHLASTASEFTIVLESSLYMPGRLGPAGIAIFPNGDIIVGLYSDGALVKATQSSPHMPTDISLLPLERALENPDGLLALADGRLLVLEGAAESGDGRLNLIDLNATPPYPVHTVLNGIESPLNLTLKHNKLYVTESRIRHLLLGDQTMPVPSTFYLREIKLNGEMFSGISGKKIVDVGEKVTYQVMDIPDVNYQWFANGDAKIVSGNGSSTVDVIFNRSNVQVPIGVGYSDPDRGWIRELYTVSVQ